MCKNVNKEKAGRTTACHSNRLGPVQILGVIS